MSFSARENQPTRDYNNWRRGPQASLNQEKNVGSQPTPNQYQNASQGRFSSASFGGGAYIGRGRKVEEGSKIASSQTRNFSYNRPPRTLGALGPLGAGSFSPLSAFNPSHARQSPAQVTAPHLLPRGMFQLPVPVGHPQLNVPESISQPNTTYRRARGTVARLPSTQSQLSTSSNEANHWTPTTHTPRAAEPESGPANWEPAPNAERPRRLFNQGTPLQQCIKKVTALLNKLSIKNFDSISNQVLEKLETSEEADHEEIAKSIFGVIFKKSLDEHAYAEIYAQLVRSILDKVAPPPEKAMYNTKAEDRQTLFRSYLLGQCQEFFEAIWPKDVEVGSTSAEAPKAEPERLSKAVDFSDAYYAEQKLKRHRIGLVGFIGELFTLKIVAPQIVGLCLTQLLRKAGDGVPEADIESACAMVAKVGPAFDSRNPVPPLFEATLRRLKQVQDAQAPNSRMKFLIMNLLESRATGWKKA